MSATQTQTTHPRRRPHKASHPQAASSNVHGYNLRKGNTFSPRTSTPSELLDLEGLKLKYRSPTSGTQNLLGLIEELSTFSHAKKIIRDLDESPIPRSFLANYSAMETEPMDIDPKPSTPQRSPHEHASDSGLGSSVSGSKYGDSRTLLSSPSSISTSVSSTRGAITGSYTAVGGSDDKHMLSEYASKQIREFIIDPILAEDSLKDFHPLIQDVPRRIGEKNITNLRDLEKTLIFLAPEFSATPKSYLEFCETSIRLLHATVSTLAEQDQRLPSDRPYTNNYFLDLIEQIRRYAAIMAATRQKEANGEDLDDMDYTPGEKITIRGGLSHNGRPAELVREKDGKVIPLNEHSPSEEAYKGFSSKRTLSDAEMDDDEVMRSMARRRKSDKPGDVMHVCRDCKKDFKRPCDLTKHEKTHSRPWKCSESKCKYFDLGWPTEKERDRHVNDKHSAAPPQYKCLYPPCTYASKRESNCKQHMEKAHGWEYVRSKSNGRKKATTTAGSERSPPTPLTPFLGTPQSANLATPMTPFIPSPSVPLIGNFDYPYGFGTPAMSVHDFQDDYRRDSVTTDGSVLTYSSGHSPTEPNAFDEAVTPENLPFDHNAGVFNQMDCSGLTTNFNTFQQNTPAMSTGDYDFSSLNLTVNTSNNPTGFTHLSPGAQPDVTLFSPPMHIDEGFGDGMENFGRPTGDFTLFDNTNSGDLNLNNTNGFFGDMGGQFDSNMDLYADPSMPMSNFDELMGFGHPQ